MHISKPYTNEIISVKMLFDGDSWRLDNASKWLMSQLCISFSHENKSVEKSIVDFPPLH